MEKEVFDKKVQYFKKLYKEGKISKVELKDLIEGEWQLHKMSKLK